jgi:hypothetical protein
LRARKARWDLADLPEKKANPGLPDLRDLLDLLAPQARRARLALLEMQVPPALHLRDRFYASSVEPIRSPVETTKFWCRSSVRAARATVVGALAQSPVFAPESSCARTASTFAGKKHKVWLVLAYWPRRAELWAAIAVGLEGESYEEQRARNKRRGAKHLGD